VARFRIAARLRWRTPKDEKPPAGNPWLPGSRIPAGRGIRLFKVSAGCRELHKQPAGSLAVRGDTFFKASGGRTGKFEVLVFVAAACEQSRLAVVDLTGLRSNIADREPDAPLVRRIGI
jgi:hypothetical protein